MRLSATILVGLAVSISCSPIDTTMSTELGFPVHMDTQTRHDEPTNSEDEHDLELSDFNNTDSDLSPRGIWDDPFCERRRKYGTRCSLKRDGFYQGARNKADPAGLSKCLQDLFNDINPYLPGQSEKEKRDRELQWNNGGWLCADRVFQFGSTHHKRHYPITVYNYCTGIVQIAADQGRDWQKCVVSSPMGRTRRHWIAWSPRGCRNGRKWGKSPNCKKEYEQDELHMQKCMNPPCVEKEGGEENPVPLHGGPEQPATEGQKKDGGK